MSRVEYRVIQSDTLRGLVAYVSRVLNDGGVLEGGIAVVVTATGFHYYQAYTIDVDEVKNTYEGPAHTSPPPLPPVPPTASDEIIDISSGDDDEI